MLTRLATFGAGKFDPPNLTQGRGGIQTPQQPLRCPVAGWAWPWWAWPTGISGLAVFCLPQSPEASPGPLGGRKLPPPGSRASPEAGNTPVSGLLEGPFAPPSLHTLTCTYLHQKWATWRLLGGAWLGGASWSVQIPVWQTRYKFNNRFV
ncbi:hypothetical protein E2320_001410 [Naja naja]|nr:hypothetical protein E2320_001410 [Naja naja]